MKKYCKINLNLVIICMFTPFFLVGCSTLGTYNPATERNEFIIISTSEEISMGQSLHSSLLQKDDLSTSTFKNERINRIGNKLALVSDRQDYKYNFYVVEKDDINAFTTPGGNIYMYTGLLDKLKTDDQIASVIAHEMGHCAAKHVVKKYQASLGYNLISSLVLANLGVSDSTKNIAARGSGTVMGLVFSAYSREDEYEADRLGVKYMYLAGLDLNSIVETLAILKQESKGNQGLLLLRSHPYLDDRIVAVKEAINRTKLKYGNNPNK